MDDTIKSTENIHLQDSEAAAELEEEALSLSGLIVNSEAAESTTDYSGQLQDARSRSSAEPSDFFEFFSEISSEMSHAEDIFFCGKLLPSYKEQAQPSRHTRKQSTRDDKLQSFCRRRSESMSELNTIPSNTRKYNLLRNSRSLDYRKLYGKSEKMEVERSLSTKSSGSKTDAQSLKEKVPPRPKWYFLTFGLVKFPTEMALQDIRNRQVRRNQGTSFRSFHAAEKDLTNRDDRRSFWDLLGMLSCKDDASVAVTTSFGCYKALC